MASNVGIGGFTLGTQGIDFGISNKIQLLAT